MSASLVYCSCFVVELLFCLFSVVCCDCVSSFCILWFRFVSVVVVLLELVVCFLWFVIVCVLCV